MSPHQSRGPGEEESNTTIGSSDLASIGLMHITSAHLSTGQSSVLRLHMSAREAKKHSCLPSGKGNEFWQIHASFCHCRRVEDVGFEPGKSGSGDLLFTRIFYHLTVNNSSKSEKSVES